MSKITPSDPASLSQRPNPLTREHLEHTGLRRADQGRWTITVDFVPINHRGPIYVEVSDSIMNALIVNELKDHWECDARILTFHSDQWPSVEITGKLSSVLEILAGTGETWILGLTESDLDGVLEPAEPWTNRVLNALDQRTADGDR